MMQIQVRYPRSQPVESAYIAALVFGDRLGLQFDLVESPDERWSVVGNSGERGIFFGESARDLIIEKNLFSSTYCGEWSRTISQTEVDDLGLEVHAGIAVQVPPGRGSDGEAIIEFMGDGRCDIRADLLEAIFIILTGEPETSCIEKDVYGRHTNLNTRWILGDETEVPIVDVYIDLISKCLSRVFGDLGIREPDFRVSPSHDVDSPSMYQALSAAQCLRRCVADFTKRRAPFAAPRTALSWLAARRGNVSQDPNYTFEWIMDQSEGRGLQSTFYFITDHTDLSKDGCYSMEDPFIRRLLLRIHERGHMIGLHPSSETYLDGAQVRREFERLLSTCNSLGIQQNEWGSRQHYLKWRTPDTARHLAEAGIAHDGTLGIADGAGFRNGTCHPFRIFDTEAREVLELIERPLVLMECSVIDSRYLGLGCGEEAFELMKGLKDTCRQFGGDFQLLWHNDRFARPEERELYCSILDS